MCVCLCVCVWGVCVCGSVGASECVFAWFCVRDYPLKCPFLCVPISMIETLSLDLVLNFVSFHFTRYGILALGKIQKECVACLHNLYRSFLNEKKNINNLHT